MHSSSTRIICSLDFPSHASTIRLMGMEILGFSQLRRARNSYDFGIMEEHLLSDLTTLSLSYEIDEMDERLNEIRETKVVYSNSKKCLHNTFELTMERLEENREIGLNIFRLDMRIEDV